MPSEHIQSKIDKAPTTPGVYLMKDAKGRVFYIGKAKNLRNRLRSYFSGSDTRSFVLLLDRLLDDIEVLLTPTEQEALIVENDLIKEHRPRHNVKLVDDKRYLCLRLDPRKTYPRVEIRRSFKRDGARYFGPYSSATSIRQTLNILNRYFQLRTCTDHVLNNRSRPCLQYQIKRCPAPCVYDLSDGAYQKMSMLRSLFWMDATTHSSRASKKKCSDAHKHSSTKMRPESETSSKPLNEHSKNRTSSTQISKTEISLASTEKVHPLKSTYS